MESIYAAFPAAIAGSLLAVREAWRAWQPARLLLAGRYEEAARAGEELDRSWMRLFPGVRASARYAIACARHLAGDLEASLEATATLPTRDRYDVRSLDAASLVLLDRDESDAERVLALLDGLEGRVAEDFLLEALARHRLGKDALVPREVTGALPPAGDRASIFHFLRGLYYARVRQLTHLAEEDLTLAANGPHTNVYTRRARAMLDDRPIDDGPSSLAPHVVAKSHD